MKIAVVGAGPIGLEAAVAADDHGHDVTVFERGEVAEAVRRWGHVRMFSTFEMNSSALGRARLENLPAPGALLSGREFVESYLVPLAATLPVRTGVEVAKIGRAQLFKGEKIGDRQRSLSPFRLLLRNGEAEEVEKADVVLDCSGTFFCPNHLGDGGILAVGERSCRDSISYGVPDVGGTEAFAGKKVLVIGSGHSAATIVRDLATLPRAHIIWATRKNSSTPCRRIPDDPLAKRDALSVAANELARGGAVDFRPGRTIIELNSSGTRTRVTLKNGEAAESVTVDRIIAAVGFRPDLELARELQVKTCYATEGVFNLAAALLGEAGGDCLSRGGFGIETLLHPEPGYFTLGMKSYGRTSDFLIRTGREQIDAVLDWLDRQ